MMGVACTDDQAEEGNKEENAPDLRNMNVLLRDGSTAQVFVDASWEVSDVIDRRNIRRT